MKGEGVRIAGWCLRITTSIAAFGLAGQLLPLFHSAPAAIDLPFEWGGGVLWWMQLVSALTAAVLGALVLARPRPFPLLLLVLLFGTGALYRTIPGGGLSYLTPAAEASRYLAPLVLLVLASRGACTGVDGGPTSSPEWLLALGASATFAAHGVEAILHHPPFFGLIQLSAANLLGLRIGEDPVRIILSTVGAIDLLLAALVLIRPHPVVLGYMSFWGLATAASRMTGHGLFWWHETLVRAPNGGVPLTLLLLRWRDSLPEV